MNSSVQKSIDLKEQMKISYVEGTYGVENKNKALSKTTISKVPSTTADLKLFK